MKYLALLCLLLVAAIQIHTVYYDPFDESNSEFILLENTANTSITLDDWAIATTTSQHDATLSGVIAPNGLFLLADEGWNDSRDNISWPEADYEESLSLANTKGFVQLLDDKSQVIDTLGWGDIDVFDTQPHPGVREGYGLVRINNTENNAEDFTEQNVSFTNHNTAGTSKLNVTITNSPPTLLQYHIHDESPDSQAVTLRPIPGEVRFIDMWVLVEDNNGMDHVEVEVQGVLLNTTNESTQANFTGQIPITTSTNEITIHIRDEEFEEVITLDVELLAITSLRVPEDISLTSAPGETTNITIPLTNIGTQPLDVHIRAEMPSWGDAIGEMTYVLAGANYTLTNDYNTHQLSLKPGEEIEMVLSVRAGFVAANEYITELIIAGVPT